MTVSSIVINLERPSGIYYAGEVVRGTTTLIATTTTKCRGFHITFSGKGHCHWHTGAGDNRRDFDGTTVFQHVQQTLHGSYHKTSILDNAGSDAIFNVRHDDGVIYIPCCDYNNSSNNDLGTTTMPLCVRVMDYDWGKRDDLLGECMIDAIMVANATRDTGQPQCFTLTRNGKPERGGAAEVVLSAKFVPFNALYATNNGVVGGGGDTSNDIPRVSTSVQKTSVLVLTIHRVSLVIAASQYVTFPG